MSAVTELPAWQALLENIEPALQTPIKSLFDDKQRFSKYSLKVQNILLDISKNPIDDNTFSLLLQLAREVGLEDRREAMFNGERINITEDRAVLHTEERTMQKNTMPSMALVKMSLFNSLLLPSACIF